MADKITNAERIEYLDSVRGLAALCVFFSHFFGSYGSPPFLPYWIWFPPITLLGDGYAAVSIFFVLSGLVLILNYFYPRQKNFSFEKDLAPYVAARVLRICVPFGAMVLVSYAAFQFFTPVNHGALIEPSEWARALLPPDHSFHEALRQLLLPFPSAQEHFLPQDWTLALELFASMLVPFFLILMRMNDWAALFLLILLVPSNWYLMHFYLGMITAKNFRFFLAGQSWNRWYRLLALIAIVPLLSNETLVKVFGEGSLTWWLNAIGAWIALVLVITSPSAQKILSLRPLVFLGRISYSTYLVHFLVLLVATPNILRYLETSGMESEEWAYGITFALSTAIVIFTSYLFHEAVEQPTILFSRSAKKQVAEFTSRIAAKLKVLR
jgi:peptidoglycan/LPS O-acetylase OafA/YrhL